MIHESHWTEQRVCSHDTRVLAKLPTAGGGWQIRQTCKACGKRTGQPLPFQDHPNWPTYPTVVTHPDPCDCHPATRQVEALTGNYDEYLASDAWKLKRGYYLGRAMHRCQICNTAGGPDGRGLNVHHRTYERVGHEIDADVVVLCRRCHELFHGLIGKSAA